jgi:hypothetical protein
VVSEHEARRRELTTARERVRTNFIFVIGLMEQSAIIGKELLSDLSSYVEPISR